jgi:hypothetical protein
VKIQEAIWKIEAEMRRVESLGTLAVGRQEDKEEEENIGE